MVANSPAEADGFATLPISMPPLPSYPVSAIHHIYMRRNTPKIATPDDSRSLFIANVPVDTTEAHFRALFTTLVGAGRFESLTLEKDRNTPASATAHEPANASRLASHQKKRKRDDAALATLDDHAAAQLPSTWSPALQRSGSTAVALLADEKSVDSVLKAVRKVNKSKSFPVWGQGLKNATSLGSQWLKTHSKLSYPGNDAIQAVVDAYFALYNKKEEDAAQLAKRLRNEPDEDGFTTVTRGGGRAAPARRDEAEEAKQRMLEREQKKKDEMTDFYKFQMRERRKAEQAELLKRFAEDKKKVEAMKEKRGKFKPEV